MKAYHATFRHTELDEDERVQDEETAVFGAPDVEQAALFVQVHLYAYNDALRHCGTKDKLIFVRLETGEED